MKKLAFSFFVFLGNALYRMKKFLSNKAIPAIDRQANRLDRH